MLVGSLKLTIGLTEKDMSEEKIPSVVEACGIRCGFDGQKISAEEYPRLLEIARDRDLLGFMRQMTEGSVVNPSENRAALHTLLRAKEEHLSDYPHVLRERQRMLDFAERVRSGAWRGFSGKRILNVINIGIGGSETGVRAVHHALYKGDETIRLHFLSACDGIRLDRVLCQCDPRSTLVVVSSKTFTTRETLANAKSVDHWFAKHGIVGERRQHHFVCVSANPKAAELMELPNENLFLYWQSIGGRFSVWGAVGLPLAIVFGSDVFKQFLAGAEKVDQTTLNTPIERNLAVLLALISYRASENPDITSRCVLPYDERLRETIGWLQQLEMESLGKPTVDGLTSRTGLPVWGQCGNDGQHSFFQWLREGVACTAIDLVTCKEAGHTHTELARSLNANARAQSEALLRREEPFYNVLTTFELDQISPETIGAFMALHEHKTAMLGKLYGINPFDQPGVELGKKISIKVEEALAQTGE